MFIIDTYRCATALVDFDVSFAICTLGTNMAMLVFCSDNKWYHIIRMQKIIWK